MSAWTRSRHFPIVENLSQYFMHRVDIPKHNPKKYWSCYGIHDSTGSYKYSWDPLCARKREQKEVMLFKAIIWNIIVCIKCKCPSFSLWYLKTTPGLPAHFHFDFLKVNTEEAKPVRYSVQTCNKNMDRWLFWFMSFTNLRKLILIKTKISV